MTEKIKLSTGALVQFAPTTGKGNWPAVLLVHGWGSSPFQGSYEEVSELLTAGGYHCLSLALRGHADADGDISTVSRKDHAADIEAAVEYLRAQSGVHKDHLAGVGVSYGAYMLASCMPILGMELVALRAPALYPNEGWEEPTTKAIGDPNLAAWRAVEHTSDESHALVGMRQFRGKLLVISSGKDEQMPPAVSDSYVHTAYMNDDITHHIIKDARHSLTAGTEREYITTLEKWFQKNYPDLD